MEIKFQCYGCKKELKCEQIIRAKGNFGDPVRKCPECGGHVFIVENEEKESIPVDKCKDGYLYWIRARNSRLGIYREDIKAFTISRYKFGSNYLFDEFHHDTGAPFGTVIPLEELEEAPGFESDKAKLTWLNKKHEEIGLL